MPLSVRDLDMVPETCKFHKFHHRHNSAAQHLIHQNLHSGNPMRSGPKLSRPVAVIWMLCVSYAGHTASSSWGILQLVSVHSSASRSLYQHATSLLFIWLACLLYDVLESGKFRFMILARCSCLLGPILSAIECYGAVLVSFQLFL